MRQQSINYAAVLYELNISPDTVQRAVSLLESTPQLTEVLVCRAFSYRKKEAVIKKVFEKAEFEQTFIHFLCYLCRQQELEHIREIADAYETYAKKRKNILTATLYYVTPPDKQQEERLKQWLCAYFQAEEAELAMVEKKELLGGFMIEANGQEFDWSLKGRMEGLRQNLIRR